MANVRDIDSKSIDEINRAMRILNHDLFVLMFDIDDLRNCMREYPENSLAQTMQNFAELTDEFNDFCDTMLEGLRG